MNQKMGLIGRKVGMTQLFEDSGQVHAVTVVELGPCTVLQVKQSDGNDGYSAVQLGFGTATHSNRPESGHAKKAGLEAAPRVVREFRVAADQAKTYSVGQTVAVGDLFSEGSKVDVIGTSKGRGFAGVIKKFHFAGFIRSHGTHEFFRHGGSIGTRLTPGHVMKGKKMPGQLGNVRVTVQNIRVVRVDGERNLLFLKGGVPGPNGGGITVRQAVKG
jgi:large subunit ribosomal protein L3